MKKLNPAQLQQLAKEYEANAPVDELAERYGINKQTVVRYMLEAGQPTPAQRLAQQNEALGKRVAELANAGRQVKDIAADLGINEKTVRTLRDKFGMTKEQRDLLIVNLWNADHSRAVIAARAGVHYATVTRVLQRNGIQP